MNHTLTILAVADLERSAAFYEEVFGWSREVSVPVYVEFEQPGGHRFGVYQRDSFALNTGGVPAAQPGPNEVSATELYFHVEDLDAAEARLHAAGATLLAPRCNKPWGDEASYFADLDRNVLVVARALGSSGE